LALFAAFHPLNARRKFVALALSPENRGGGAPNRAPDSPVFVEAVVIVGNGLGVGVN
jgi:hypothetical protein